MQSKKQRSSLTLGLSKLNGLYREVILDYADHPHNKGELATTTNAMTLHNPTCGAVSYTHLTLPTK